MAEKKPIPWRLIIYAIITLMLIGLSGKSPVAALLLGVTLLGCGVALVVHKKSWEIVSKAMGKSGPPKGFRIFLVVAGTCGLAAGIVAIQKGGLSGKPKPAVESGTTKVDTPARTKLASAEPKKDASCTSDAMRQLKELKKKRDPEALNALDRAVACARKDLSRDTASESAKETLKTAEKIRAQVDKDIVPSAREFRAHKMVDKMLFEKNQLGEEKVKRIVAKRMKMSASELEAADLKATVYVAWFAKNAVAQVKRELRILSSNVEDVIFQPFTDGIIVKLYAKTGWSGETMKRAIQKDLILTVGVIFSVSPVIQLADVWVVADTTAGKALKVATVTVKRPVFKRLGPKFFKDAQPKSVARLNPWYVPSLR